MELRRTALLGPAKTFHSPPAQFTRPTSKGKQYASNQRKTARKKMDEEFSKGLFTNCHWCLRELLLHRNLPTENYIEPKPVPLASGRVVVRWEDFPAPVEFRIATVDHLKALHQGGKSSRANLVWACLECNQGRHRQTK